MDRFAHHIKHYKLNEWALGIHTQTEMQTDSVSNMVSNGIQFYPLKTVNSCDVEQIESRTNKWTWKNERENAHRKSVLNASKWVSCIECALTYTHTVCIYRDTHLATVSSRKCLPANTKLKHDKYSGAKHERPISTYDQSPISKFSN